MSEPSASSTPPSSRPVTPIFDEHFEFGKQGCACLRTSLIALAVIALIATAVATLAYFGILNVGIEGVGSLVGSTAFWTMMCGAGITILALFAYAAVARCCIPRERAPTTSPRSSANEFSAG